MKIIKLTKGFEAIVDDENYEYLNQFKWHNSQTGKDNKYNYARARYHGKNVKMHRLILSVFDENVHVDHINGNTLDNRKINLRACSRSENKCNSIKNTKTSSIYKGVSYDEHGKKKWKACTTKDGKNIYLGRFESEIEAAKAYDAYAREHYGEFAKINF